MLYASGEIILVVVGILIALQINNYNEDQKSRAKEIIYLKKLREDLKVNISKIETFIDRGNSRISTAKKLIGYFDGEPVENWHTFNLQTIEIYTWPRFYQHNYTFQELISSGNLAYITGDSIKNLLFELESTYKELKAEEDHWRFDSEELIFKPAYEAVDFQRIIRDYMGEEESLSQEIFSDFFSNRKIKNGYVMATIEFSEINKHLKKMHTAVLSLIDLIDNELEKEY